jgi:hypothetical protein
MDIGPKWAAGDYSRNEFWGRKTVLEVGGARLFETPQSGVWKRPRFLDPTDGDANCDDNAYCDSGVYYTSGKRPKPSNTDDAQVTFEYDDTGNQYAKVLGEDREKVATVRVCVPQSKGDRERRAEADLEGKD